jgi:hypothetical protein
MPVRRKEISTATGWKIALVFSAKSTNPAGTSCWTAAIAIPQTKAAIRPLRGT